MGQVYLAKHRVLGKKVAIKILHQRYAADHASVSRFFREAQTACTIEHDNIVEITDFVENEGGRAFYVMAYLKGRTLRERLNAGRLSLKEALSVARQIADALAALHDAAVVHRDLKPANIFLVRPRRSEEPEQVKLLDFGLAKLTDLRAPLAAETNPSFLIGTPEYMAPEQIKSPQDVDSRADVFAFGTLLYELLAGQRPFVAPTAGELLVKIVTAPPSPLEPRVPGLPAELGALVDACLSKEPSERPEASEILRTLLAIETTVLAAPATALAEPSPPIVPAPPRAPQGRDFPLSMSPALGNDVIVTSARGRGLWIRITLGVAILAVMATLAVFLWPTAEPHKTQDATSGKKDATIATVAEVWRSVESRPRDKRRWTLAKRLSPLHHLDALRTAIAARAEVQFTRGGTLAVAENSEILIEAPRPLVEGGPAIVQVARLRHGLLRATTAPGVPLRIFGKHGSAALIRTRGHKKAHLRLREHRDGRLEVAVLKGQARIGRGEGVLLGPDEILDLRGSHPGPATPLLKVPSPLAPTPDERLTHPQTTLRWRPIPGAKTYELQIGAGRAFIGPRLSRRTESTHFTLHLPGGPYIWQVRAIDPQGHPSEYSLPRHFAVTRATTRPSMLRPPPAPDPLHKGLGVSLLPPASTRIELGRKREKITLRWRQWIKARLVLATSPSLAHGVVASTPVAGRSGTLAIPRPGSFYWGLCPRRGCTARHPRLSATRRLEVHLRRPPSLAVPPIDWHRSPGKMK